MYDDISLMLEGRSVSLLPLTYFKCARCDEWRTIETAGTILHGPACKHCGQTMKRVHFIQTELNLFPKERTTKRKA